MQLLLILLNWALWLLVPFANGSDSGALSSRGLISFENADITVSIKTHNGEKIAEAFNATRDVKDGRKMRWVSLGLPRLLIRKDSQSISQVC